MEKRYSGRRRRHLRWLWLLMIPVLAAGYTLWRFGPQRSYTARQLGLTDLQSPNDADGDGVVDETDARIIMEHYLSGGKPADANAFLSLDWNGDWQLSALDAQRNLLYRYTITQTGGEEE